MSKPVSKVFFHFSLFFLLLLWGVQIHAAPSGAPASVEDFPENVFVRNRLIDEVLGPLEAAAKMQPDLFTEPGYTHRVQFFIEETEEFLYFCFYHGRETRFAEPVRGSIYFKRSRETGRLLKMKIFYKNDAGSYLAIEPEGESMSRLNIFLLQRNIQQDILIPMSLDEIARMPVSEIMRNTTGYVDWSFYLPGGEFPFPVLTSNDELVDQIRPYFSQLEDADDGAMDESGRYVFIRDDSFQGDGTAGGLNCSGFAKWVVDGILYPLTGSFLPVEPLKEKHPDFRGNRWSSKAEDLEDPYFGLDWTRNLAVRAFLTLFPEMKAVGGLRSDPEAADVNYLRYHEYEEDVGYPVGQLPTILYELARRNVDRFYLGSVNMLTHGEHDLRRHYHVAVFIPWLDSEGGLEVSIMERNTETSLENFVERYRGNYIHLVEVPNPGGFKPGNMQLEPVIKR